MANETTSTETSTETETTIDGTTATDYLGLTLPDPGYAAGQDPSWPELIVQAFDAIDAKVEIRDLDENRSDYEPKGGAKYLATDTGDRYIGDGSSWTTIPAPGDGSLSSHSGNHESGGSDEISVEGLSGDLADPQDAKEHGNAAHSSTYISDGDGTERQIWVVENGASDPSGASADDIIFEEEA